MVDTIHVHEDDWGMRNLYPLATRIEVEADIAKAAEVKERCRAPSGIGWTEIYMVKPPTQDYSDLGLTLQQAENAISPFLPRVHRFNATILSAMGSAEQDPYGSYEVDAWCFGFGPECYLKVDAKDDLVSCIWFDLCTVDAEATRRLRSALEAIDGLVPSIIADYFLDFSGPVSESEVLDRYFAAIADRQRRAEQAALDYRASEGQKARFLGLVSKHLSIFRGNR